MVVDTAAAAAVVVVVVGADRWTRMKWTPCWARTPAAAAAAAADDDGYCIGIARHERWTWRY